MEDPHLIKRETIGDGLQHALHPEAPLARAHALPWMLFIVMLAVSAWLTWRAFGPDNTATRSRRASPRSRSRTG